MTRRLDLTLDPMPGALVRQLKRLLDVRSVKVLP